MDHEYPIAAEPVSPQQPQATPAAPMPKRGIMRLHPYLFSIIGTLAVILVVFLVLSARIGVSGQYAGENWVGAGSVFTTGGRDTTEAQRLTAEQIVKMQSPETALPLIPIAKPSTEESETDFGNDLGKLLAQLTQPVTNPGDPASTPSNDAYSFIPQGYISTNTETGVKLSATGQALKAYGNEMGTYIQGFESLHLNTPQILKDNAEDRTNTDKAAYVKQVGYDLAALGRDMLQMQEVPEAAKAAHSAYATTYRIVGTNLTKIADAKTDDEYLSAIAAYNTSADDLTKRFLALVALFSANNVTFAESEPGSVFMFNPKLSF